MVDKFGWYGGRCDPEAADELGFPPGGKTTVVCLVPVARFNPGGAATLGWLYAETLGACEALGPGSDWASTPPAPEPRAPGKGGTTNGMFCSLEAACDKERPMEEA